MSRRLGCEDCLRSDKPTAYQSELGRRVCQACYAEAAKPQPLTAADDPWPTGVDTQPFGEAS